jgi:hypothetical protein
MLNVMRKAKNMVFQPQFEQSFNASTSFPPTYGYNFQSRDLPAIPQIPNIRSVNSPIVSDALNNESSKFFDLL